MNLSFRPATSADRPFVEALFFETQRAIMEQVYDWCPDARQSTSYFESFYCEESTRIILVDDKDAGFLSVLREDNRTNIQCLFLTSEHRGRGIGTQLLQDLIAQASIDGTLLTIGTETVNRAKRLYARLGFVAVWETGRRIEFEYPRERDVRESA